MPTKAHASHLQLLVSAIAASSLDDFKVHISAGILRLYYWKTCYLKVLVLFKTKSVNCPIGELSCSHKIIWELVNVSACN